MMVPESSTDFPSRAVRASRTDLPSRCDRPSRADRPSRCERASRPAAVLFSPLRADLASDPPAFSRHRWPLPWLDPSPSGRFSFVGGCFAVAAAFRPSIPLMSQICASGHRRRHATIESKR
jgi:hypothetical protein